MGVRLDGGAPWVSGRETTSVAGATANRAGERRGSGSIEEASVRPDGAIALDEPNGRVLLERPLDRIDRPGRDADPMDADVRHLLDLRAAERRVHRLGL